MTKTKREKQPAGYFDSNRNCPVYVGDVYMDENAMFPFREVIKNTDGFLVRTIDTDESFKLSDEGARLIKNKYVGNLTETPDLLEKLQEPGQIIEVDDHTASIVSADDSEYEGPAFTADFSKDGIKVTALNPELIAEDVEEQEDKEMSKSEARDYVEEEIDDKFMDDVTPVKLTPAQREKKIVELQEDIENSKKRMEELEPIADLANSEGFRKLVEEVKTQIHKKVDEEDIKATKDGSKSFEAVLLTEKIAGGFRSQYNGIKSDIKSWEDKIVELKNGQLTIFDELEKVETAEEETTQELEQVIEQEESTIIESTEKTEEILTDAA